MKIAVPPRHRRLFALCGLSAAAHLLVLNLVAEHGAGARPGGHRAAEPLVLRLAPLPAATPAVAAVAAVPTVAAVPRPPQRSPVPATKAAPATPAVTDAAPSPALAPALPARSPLPAGAPGAQPLPFDSPSLRPHYQIATPASLRLVYRVDAGAAPAPAGAAAYLEWRSDGSTYALEMDGVLGRRSSSGIVGDDGIAPQHAREQQGERSLETTFDAARQRVTLADGTETAAQSGTLDGAMVWIWLASIASASAGQLRDRIGVTVADAGGVHPLRFDVVGAEDVETGLGPIKAWHLAQYARPGEARVDAWLAPEQDWLPVQLRVTRPDGSMASQVLQRREAVGAP